MVYVWKPREDGEGYLDGGRHYRLHLPPTEASTVFWSVVVCDAANRSGSTNQTSLCAWNSTPNADGSVDVYFGPTAPAGRERNWIRTMKGNSWFPRFRFYSPLEPLEEGWAPGDIVEFEY